MEVNKVRYVAVCNGKYATLHMSSKSNSRFNTSDVSKAMTFYNPLRAYKFIGNAKNFRRPEKNQLASMVKKVNVREVTSRSISLA